MVIADLERMDFLAELRKFDSEGMRKHGRLHEKLLVVGTDGASLPQIQARSLIEVKPPIPESQPLDASTLLSEYSVRLRYDAPLETEGVSHGPGSGADR
jgi:hypothetical protein